MSIDYSAAIFVGLPRSEFDAELLADLLAADELEVCPPSYDGGGGDDHAIAGFSVKESPDYAAVEFTWDAPAVARLKAEFKELTGLDARVWLSPCGS